jgi:hypothetical protein
MNTPGVAPGCEGCRFWRPFAYGLNACHYSLDHEVCRPCKPGKGCVVRVDKKRGEIVRKGLILI